MSGYIFAGLICVVLAIFLIQLLRKRRIREKYTALWLLLSAGTVLLAFFPGIAGALAKVVGVQVPANLVFAAALLVLLVVCIQLSVAISQLEERTRTLAEENALLREQVEQLRQRAK